MQTYTRITNDFTGAELPGKIDENLQSLKSDFSGTAFPTENLVEGMTCYRTDLDTEYRYVGGAWKVSGIATQAEAMGGSGNTKVMTPLRTKDAIDKQRPIKSYSSNDIWNMGFQTNGTWADLFSLMEAQSEVMFVASPTSHPNLNLPVSSTVRIRAEKYDSDVMYMQLYIAGNTAIEYIGKFTASTFSGWNKVFVASDIATQAEAESGTDNITVMTPLRSKQLGDKNYLPLSGGTMTGELSFSTSGNRRLKCADANDALVLWGGTNYQSGASLYLFGTGSTDSRQGGFQLNSRNGDVSYSLDGRKDGRLLWRGNDVMTAYTIWSHSNYRGKDLGTSLTTAQSNAIRNGTFDDIYVGDYWTIGGVVYRIVAIDYYYNCGDTACTTHHVVVVPDTTLYSAQMNTSNVVTGGYVGSAMYTSNLATAKTTILNAFGSGHILTIRQYFSNAASSYVTGGTWADANVWLMNEINVYGCSVFANLVHSTNWVAAYTIDNCQYPAFRANPRLIHTRQTYWLRDVASSTTFAGVSDNGAANGDYAASSSLGVRPAFCVY